MTDLQRLRTMLKRVGDHLGQPAGDMPCSVTIFTDGEGYVLDGETEVVATFPLFANVDDILRAVATSLSMNSTELCPQQLVARSDYRSVRHLIREFFEDFNNEPATVREICQATEHSQQNVRAALKRWPEFVRVEGGEFLQFRLNPEIASLPPTVFLKNANHADVSA